MLQRILSKLKSSYLDHIILGLYPIAQALINSNWIFSPIQPLRDHPFQDVWFYTGNFLYFYDYANQGFTKNHYFVERLPWNIPGYFLYHLLSPLTANYVLHLASYYIAVFSLYWALTTLFGRRTGLIVALAMGAYPWFLRAAGWDYVDGPGIAYFMLTTALIIGAVRSSSSRWRVLLLLAGIAAASATFTHLFWFPFIAVLLALYAVLNSRAFQHNLLISLLSLLAGAAIAAATFGTLNYFAAGRFFFLQNSLGSGVKLAESSSLRSILEAFYAGMPAYWLILPCLLLLAGAYAIASRTWRREENAGFVKIALLLFLAVSFAIIVALHAFTTTPFLIMFPYVSYLLPSIFILLGALVSEAVEDLSESTWRIVLAASILLFLAPLTLTIRPRLWNLVSALQGNPLLVALSAVLLLGALLSRKRWSVLMSCATLACLSFSVGRDANVFIPDRSKLRDSFLAVMETVRTIQHMYPAGAQDLVFMYDPQDRDVPGLPIGAIYMDPWGRFLPYTEDTAVAWRQIVPFNGKDILLIAQSRNGYRRMQRDIMSTPGIAQLILKKRVTVRSGSLTFYLSFFHFEFPPALLRTLRVGQKFEFDSPFDGQGFYGLEEDAVGRGYVWSGPEPTSEIQFKLDAPQRDIPIEICSIFALKQSVAEGFQLFVNDVRIPTELRFNTPDCPILYEGTIPKGVVESNPTRTVLRFTLPETVGVDQSGINPSDHRKVGLALDWIEIR